MRESVLAKVSDDLNERRAELVALQEFVRQQQMERDALQTANAASEASLQDLRQRVQDLEREFIERSKAASSPKSDGE